MVSDPILPASKTFNQTFKNMNYCKQTENLHATLDSHLVFDDFFNTQIALLKNVLATFCRSDKFKSTHTLVQPFEFIRSTKGCQHLKNKTRFTTQVFPNKRNMFQKVKSQVCSMLSHVKRCAYQHGNNRFA